MLAETAFIAELVTGVVDLELKRMSAETINRVHLYNIVAVHLF